jgi:predicted HTH domain antitoxin
MVMVNATLVPMDDRQNEDERVRRQRRRNIAIALALAGLVVLFYIATIARLGGNVFTRPV